MEQRSEEWFAIRCGLATASRFKDILAKIKTGESASRRNYKAQLVCERLTGRPQESYSNGAMQWGIDNESFARIAYEYEFCSNTIIREAGFFHHPNLQAGCSPDGLVGEDGGIEIKCPFQTAVHIETLLSGMPSEHEAQIQGAMWITGRKWWDFVSYDPRMPQHLQLYVQRIYRNEEYISKLEEEVSRFLDEVQELINQLPKAA